MIIVNLIIHENLSKLAVHTGRTDVAPVTKGEAAIFDICNNAIYEAITDKLGDPNSKKFTLPE